MQRRFSAVHRTSLCKVWTPRSAARLHALHTCWQKRCECRVSAALNETIATLPSAMRVSLEEVVVYQAHTGGSPGGQPNSYRDEHIIL